jgi:hypothetical protein
VTTGRELPPSSPFAADDGSQPVALGRALAGTLDGTATVLDVVTELAGARVLVPVMAEAEACEVTDAGLVVDRQASNGVVALRAPDGRTALPVFSGVAQMAAWRADARPVPATAQRAAASAVQEGWDLLVLDPAGPAVVVPRPAVRALAEGSAWVPAVQTGQVRSAVVDAVRAAVGGLPGVLTVDAVPGRSAEVAIVLGLRPGLDRPALDAVLEGVGRALAADAVVATTVDSLELRVVAAGRPSA